MVHRILYEATKTESRYLLACLPVRRAGRAGLPGRKDSQRPMGSFPLRLSISLLLMLLSCSLFAQTKSELQKQRDELNKKIELTKKLIGQSEDEQQTTAGQVQMLNQQIAFREELLANIGKDVSTIEEEIGEKEEAVDALESKLKALKKEYGDMILYAYKNRSSYDKLMYIFSAENFNQAYKRMRLMQSYAEVRTAQLAMIATTQKEIEQSILGLEVDRSAKQSLATEKEKEKNKIASDKKEQQNKLSSLKTEEKKLRTQQKKHESDRKTLTSKIDEIIRKEIEKAKPKTTTPSNTTTSSKKIELAPEAKIINADFEKNKGSLPWPVSAGVITLGYGVQPHPVVSGAEINSKGIDFTTEKNASVLSVFNGEVSSVFSIPGAGQNIIVTHGSYKSVYSGLNTVSVKVGDKVNAKQTLGTVLYDGEQTVLHFEVWKVNTDGGVVQNPSLWLKKR
ncbi:MAG: peptidoglycan DD-metalloendopeptidase family protein [Flavobacteriales bacterium]|nr:peptidoglycan DD-metalloendopeptidase family protein [Flavobacteriales bacterium]